MHPHTVRALAVACVTAVTLACDDVPLLPQWEADFYAPLGNDNVTLPPPGTVVPASSSISVPGDIRAVPMDGFAGDVLGEVLGDSAPNIRLEVRIAKTANLSASLADTIYFAASSAGLASTTIAEGIAMAAGATELVDTLQLGTNAINLLKQQWNANDSLYLQARGRVATGGSAITIQSGDSINVRVGLLVRVPVAGGGN